MNCIGIRVKSSTEVYFTVLDFNGSDINIKTIDSIKVPISMDMPDQLSYIRTTLFSIVNEYNIINAGLRRMEDTSQSKLEYTIKRAYFEGVIQELISNCTIEKYFSGKISRIGSLLGKSAKDIKTCIDGVNNIFSINGWENYIKEERESILCALASTQI